MSNGIEWGSVADWVSGIGSMAAVFAALTIAFVQLRRAKSARREARATEIKRHHALRREALRLADDMETTFGFMIEMLEQAPASKKGEFVRSILLDTMAGIREQLTNLQGFPNDDPRLYVEIGRLKTLCDFESNLDREPTLYVIDIVKHSLERLPERHQAISNLEAVV